MNKKKYFLSLYLFFLGAFALHAQTFSNAQTDSVASLLLKAPDAKEQKVVFDSLATVLAKQKNKMAVYEGLLQKIGNKPRRLQNMIHLKMVGQLLMMGDVNASFPLLYKMINNSKAIPDTVDLIVSYQTIANTFITKVQLDSAFSYLTAAEKLTTSEKYKEERWRNNYEWSYYYGTAGNKQKWGEYLEKTWEHIKTNEKYENKKGFILYTIADNFLTLKDVAKHSYYADLYLKRAFSNNVPIGHIPIKNFYINDSNQKESLEKLYTAISVADSLKHYFLMGTVTTALDDYTIKKGGGRMAILPVYLKLITHLTEKSHNNLLLEVYSRIRSIYESNGDYKTALQYNKLYHGLKDSVTSVQLKSKLQELEVEYETAKKQKTIDENKLLIAKKNNQKMLLASLLAIVLLAGVGTVLWLRHKLKAGKIIAAQSEKIKDQEILNLQKENKVLALNSMLEGQEAERGRVAKDLHDGLGGLLSTVKAHFSKIQSEIQQLENLQLYTKTNALIDEACVEVRRIAHNMAPESITTAGLKGAIEDLAANINIQGVQCTVEVADGINNLPQSKAVMIYRVIQEICHNAVKHSQSPTLLLQVLDSNQIIKILIEDNGVGLDVSAAEQKKGMGLKSIYSRVSYLNGTILIDSVPNKGTTINIDIPAA